MIPIGLGDTLSNSRNINSEVNPTSISAILIVIQIRVEGFETIKLTKGIHIIEQMSNME